MARNSGLPLVQRVGDLEGWMPTKHKNGHIPLYEGRSELPPSLNEAIDAFVLACAPRQLRGQEAEHCSMLVHVTRYTSVQKAVHNQVEERVRHLRQRLHRRTGGHEEIISSFRALWERDFVPTIATMADDFSDNAGLFNGMAWEEIELVLAEALADIQLRMIKSTAKDALDYAEN